MTELPEGHSGYFSVPSHGLDPHLFDAEHMKPEVREWLWNTLADELGKAPLDLEGVGEWLYAWVAGSGVTYQWNADRGLTGDLDVLFGVDYVPFVRANPSLAELPEDRLAAWLNSMLKEQLWPKTAHANINGQVYEVTFYDNPGTRKDIRDINPYAAYDLRQDKWAVRPPTKDYLEHRVFPQDWQDIAKGDEEYARAILSRYAGASTEADRRRFGQSARTMFDSIHLGRRAAFAPGGKGFGDFTNYRWQAAKRSGAIAGLSNILDVEKQAKESQDEELYGGPITGADMLLNRMLFNRRPNS